MLRRISTFLLLTIAATAAIAAPAAAADPIGYRTLRICDPTACYLAWHVVDSDHDGYSDADELAAGTDPFDAASHPLLQHIAQLAVDRKLPSFEYGLGGFVAFPAEILEARKKLGIDPLGAFPLHERKDTLTRLGISGDLLAKLGVSPESGFSLGLDHPSTSGELPGVRVAGIEASLISAGTPSSHASRGGIVERYTDWGGSTVNVFADGSKDTVTKTDLGWRVETTDASGNYVGAVEKDTYDYKEDGTHVTKETERTYDADDNHKSTRQSETHTYASGATNTYTVVTEYVLDEDGNVVGVIVTESNEYHGADGSYSKGETKKVCDADGQQCSEKSTYTEDSGKYADPDQAYSNMVSVEEVADGVLRMRGAAVNVVQGWNAPGMTEDPENPRNPSTVMLVDEEIGTIFLLSEPTRTAVAQPEGRDDLPNPMRDGLGNPVPSGDCQSLCS